MASILSRSSAATLIGLVPHYMTFYVFGWPLLTQSVAEWIMARTPPKCALWILENLGGWAKPFAMTGGLAVLGSVVLLLAIARKPWLIAALAAIASLAFGGWVFWVSAALSLMIHSPVAKRAVVTAGASRREWAVMVAGVTGVALESHVRDAIVSRRAIGPRTLTSFQPLRESFAPGLVRPAVTPVDAFYAMSKNSVDPSINPQTWRLKVSMGGRIVRSFRYSELLSMPKTSEYVTLRCISNTLQSDLMGTALWTGVRFNQLVDPRSIPDDIVEVALIGVDGHGDSFKPSYLFSDGALLAFGMNGQTLNRLHGFPIRLIAPRYYGFKNVKWIGEIAFFRRPYVGTWPKLGYTKEPIVHTASHIDKVAQSPDLLRIGGVSFAGDRAIKRVQVRVDDGPWVDARLDQPLSRFTWTRWEAAIPVTLKAAQVEARAQDGVGNWQERVEGPLFPDGIQGPAIRRLR